MISIPITPQSNMFNVKIIIFVSVSWHPLCLMPQNMLQTSLLPRDLNHLYTMNHLVIWLGSSLPINDDSQCQEQWAIYVAVMRFFNGKKRIIDILNDISDHVTVFQLFDTAGNFNNDVSITECWIYDSNCKQSFSLIK